MIDLAGKTALVTGASRGIGRAIALGYAAAGADLALVARGEAGLRSVAAEVAATGRRALVLPCDVTDRDAVRRTVAAALAELSHLDVLVNNAGGTSFAVPFAELRFSGWTKVMATNLDSAVHVTQALAPHLLERRTGSVLNVASIAALAGAERLTPYGAAKAALLSLTRSLALEWGRHGVRVNALCPGWTATDLNRNLWTDPAASAELIRDVPLGRWARPEEMVGAAVWLASDAASYVTGQAIVVDGGLTAG